MLLEDFKNSLPDGVITFSNEQKVMSMSKAAVVADEFLLTDKMCLPLFLVQANLQRCILHSLSLVAPPLGQ